MPFNLFVCLAIFSPQFFNQVLVMGKSSVSDLSEHVFDLIQELFAIDPLLLTSVMPQLEFKLKVTHLHRTSVQWLFEGQFHLNDDSIRQAI